MEHLECHVESVLVHQGQPAFDVRLGHVLQVWDNVLHVLDLTRQPSTTAQSWAQQQAVQQILGLRSTPEVGQVTLRPCMKPVTALAQWPSGSALQALVCA